MPLNNLKGSQGAGHFMVQNRERVKPYTTKDGSTIWELYHPLTAPVLDISIAEAYVKGDEETRLHVHRGSQEIYYILDGDGIMWLGNRRIDVRPGDAVLIPPGTPHKIKAGEGGVRILCICAPPYMHDDTGLMDI